jgi:hypothetical protein
MDLRLEMVRGAFGGSKRGSFKGKWNNMPTSVHGRLQTDSKMDVQTMGER